MIRKDRPFSILELRRRIVLPIAEVDVPTATAEDTIIAKLEWANSARVNVNLATSQVFFASAR